MSFAALILFVTLHGPHQQRIDINALRVTSLREPSGQHVKSVHCIVWVAGSGRIGVVESCEKVRHLLKGV